MKILVVSPHTDDGELGCGGMMSRFIREGHEIHYVALTSVINRDNVAVDISDEAKRSIIGVYGISSEHCWFGDITIRLFSESRQVILDWMLLLQNKYSYDMVFIPSLNDTHQDHVVVAQEGLRAFKKTTILGYELPWNNLKIGSTGFIKIDKRDIYKKVESLNCYESQLQRGYMDKEFVESWARTRGVQAGLMYAEMFEVIRWIM